MITVRTWKGGDARTVEDTPCVGAREAMSVVAFVRACEPERTVVIRSRRSGTFAIYAPTDAGRE